MLTKIISAYHVKPLIAFDDFQISRYAKKICISNYSLLFSDSLPKCLTFDLLHNNKYTVDHLLQYAMISIGLNTIISGLPKFFKQIENIPSSTTTTK